jgi:hypothetical protein
MIDQAIIDRAQAYLDANDGDALRALLVAVADNTQRSFHRLPPLTKMDWTPKIETAPLDIPPPEQAAP